MIRLHSLLPLLLPFALCACTHADHGHPHPSAAGGAAAEAETPARALTVWSATHEVFAEHDWPLPGVPAAFAVHLTRLADGAPVTEGECLLRFRRGAAVVEVRAAAPARPGIYLGEFSLSDAGEWSWELVVQGDAIALPAVEVAADAAARAAAAAAEAAAAPAAGIVMLKEQQWPIRLRTDLARERELAERVEVLVRVAAPAGGDQTLRAPISGRLLAHPLQPWPGLGAELSGNEILGRIELAVTAADAAAVGAWTVELEAARREIEVGLAAAEAALNLARERRAQAERHEARQRELLRSESAAPREHEEAATLLRIAAAEVDAAQAARESWNRAGARLEELRHAAASATPWTLDLSPARRGRVVAVHAVPGEWVEAGAPLLRVLDADRLWWSADLPLALGAVGADAALEIALPNGETLQLPGPHGRLLLRDGPADPATRTRPVLFESAAPPGVSPGALLRGRIATAGARRVLAVPVSALVDEDGIPSLYLHATGESFIKRWVRTGVRDGAWVEILDGLTAGERVVVEGAAVVRLVSLSGAIPEHSH